MMPHLLTVWRNLGGPEPRRGRAPAWWRESRDLNVSIDVKRGVFYDHVQGRGGGVLALVETVLNCDRAAALAWLEGEGLIEPRTLTREQRREHARRKCTASAVALDIARWHSTFTMELNGSKVAAVDAGDDEALARTASLCNVLENGSAEDIVREFSRHRERDPAAVARFVTLGEGRDHEARRIAAQVVLMLARAAELEDQNVQHDYDDIERAALANDGVLLGKSVAFRIEDIPSVWKCNASTKWLIDRVIPESAVTLLCGDSGIGKSTLALALAGAVAHGERFLERATPQRRVLYVDRENPLPVVRERLERLGIHETAALVVWGLWTKPMPDGPTAASILHFAAANRPLIIFDSLVGFHPGSEQDASETRRHMKAYMALAATGAAVIVLHHTGKADTAKQYRGSSDIKAAVDLAYVLESLSEPDAGIRSLRLRAFKNRLTLPETLCVEYRNGRFGVSNRQVETNREILERLIGQKPGASKADIEKLASAAGIPQKRTRALLDEGVREGWLALETGPRGRQSYHLFDVEIGVL